MLSIVTSLVLLAINVNGQVTDPSGITCTSRFGNSIRGVSKKSTVQCIPGETMVSCGLKGVQHIGGSEGVSSKDGSTCYARTDSNSYTVQAVANCCVFPKNAVSRIFTVKSDAASTKVTATCPSGSVITGCDVMYANGNYNQLLGSFAGATGTPPQTSGWIKTDNVCTAGARGGTGVTATAHCLETGPGYELECSTRATYTKQYGFVGCEESYKLMSCNTWTTSNSLDAYYINGGRCYVQQDNHASQYANGICCRLSKPQWKILLGQNTEANDGYFLPEVRETGLTNAGQPYANAFTIIGDIDPNDYITNGQYQFRLRYNDGKAMSQGGVFDEIWTQTNWLTDDKITGSSLGEKLECPDFYGLAMSTGHGGTDHYSYLDGNGHHSCWYHPVGMTTAGGALPNWAHNMPIDSSPGNIASKAQLFICTQGVDCDMSTPLLFEPAKSEPCYFLNGNPGTISGDPHTFTFAGVRHDFQGAPQNGLNQFYYVHPCKGYNHNDLPFHLLGTHFPYRGSTRVSGLDYFVIELFDHDDTQYNVFFSSAIHAYAQSENSNYDDAALQAQLVSLENIKTVAIGTRFRIHYTQSDSKTIMVTLTIDDECTLEFTMIAQNQYDGAKGRYRMHYARVNVPECYRCATCGLFGNFKGREMEDCHGHSIGYGGYENAWDPRGWTWEKTYTNNECPVLDTTTTMPPNATPRPTHAPVTPAPLPSDPCVDEDSEERKIAYDKCMAARNRKDIDECCEKINPAYCDVDDCEFDTCIMSEGDVGSMDDIVDDILTSVILKECVNMPSVDSSNWSEEFTRKPTVKPTGEPTVSPVVPTHRPSHNPTTAEPTKKPSHHPTTAKPTHRPTHHPTDEPTDSPTSEPTKKPTHRPTHHPTDEPTDEPTDSPTSEPTKKPTHRPTHHPTDEPTDSPTSEPTKKPTHRPTRHPTDEPTSSPTGEPTKKPTHRPTHHPTDEPTDSPTDEPTKRPSHNPTTREPTKKPSHHPTTTHPTRHPTTSDPTKRPSHNPTTAEPTKRPSHHPTTMDPTKRPSANPTTSDPTRRPTSGTYLTPEPTKKPTEDQSGWGEPMPTTKAPKTKAPKPTKAPRTKKPKPTKAPKTPKPTKAPKTKAPKPTKAPKTKKPKKTPEPTVGSGWGVPNPSMRGGKKHNDDRSEQVLAVDVNGEMETTFSGYSMQTEIVGMVSIAMVLLIVGYSMMCKKSKDEQYVAIEDPMPRVV